MMRSKRLFDQSIAIFCFFRIAVLLFVGHFLKREFETLFVHRFSNATMPIIRLAINCSHYWCVFFLSHQCYFFCYTQRVCCRLLCALGIGYFLCHPLYQAPLHDHRGYAYILTGLFLVSEGAL